MDEATAKQRMAELQQRLERYNEEYYVQDAPSVTDYEYDMLLRELETLEQQYPQFAAADSPTKHVGGTASQIHSNEKRFINYGGSLFGYLCKNKHNLYF